jgi:hypothetical protein
MKYEAIPPRVGHTIAAAVWKFDRARKLFRLTQVVYEPRVRVKVEKPDRPQGGSASRGALAVERQGRLI